MQKPWIHEHHQDKKKRLSKFFRVIYIKITRRNQYFCMLERLYFYSSISALFNIEEPI